MTSRNIIRIGRHARPDGRGRSLRVGRAPANTLALVVIGGALGGCTPAAAPPSATARAVVAPFVYATDRHTGGISEFGSSPSGSGALRRLAPRTVASGRTPSAAAVNPQGTSLYVLDEGTGRPVDEVTQYSINPATGKLTPKSHARTGSGAIWITIAPDSTSAYIADNYANAISQYRISPATGKLTPMSPATVKTPGAPGAIAVAPDGRYAYVADVTTHASDNVLQYRINPRTGALSSRPVATVTGGPAAESVTIAPDGKNAYVTDPIDSTVWQYRISPATGRLSLLSPATVRSGSGTHDLAIAPDGKNAYVDNAGNNTVSQFPIDAATGALSPTPASTVGTVRSPELVVLTPDGKNAYVTGDIGDLSQYAITPTGKITALAPATLRTPPGGSIGLVITPAADLAAEVRTASPARRRTLTYAVKITDTGPSNAWQVALTDHFPSGTTFLSAKATRGHCSTPRIGTNGGTVRCHLGKLRIGGVWRIQINLAANVSRRPIRDQANATTATPDPRTSNNTAAAQTNTT